MLSLPQLTTIFSLQNDINTKIKDTWLTAGYPYLRGTLVECTEAMDPQYKWWKAGEEDIENIRVELIDILHFNASHIVRDFNGDCAAAANHVLFLMDANEDSVSFDGKDYVIAELDNLMKFELMAGLAVSRRISWPLYFATCEAYGLNADSIFKTYVGKNVINTFRQDFGYKEGTYNKEGWIHEGKEVEDNVILHKHLELLDVNSPTFSTDLYNAMKSDYPG